MCLLGLRKKNFILLFLDGICVKMRVSKLTLNGKSNQFKNDNIYLYRPT